MTFFICTIVVILGNLIYTLHYSPFYLLLGRFLGGMGGALRPIMTSEVARSFNEHEAITVFAWMAMAFSLGFVAGPGVNFAFANINIMWGTWHLTYANFVGIFMALVFLVNDILIYFGISDLSLQYDPKSEGRHEEQKRILSEHQVSEEQNTNTAKLSKDREEHDDVTFHLNIDPAFENKAPSGFIEISSSEGSSVKEGSNESIPLLQYDEKVTETPGTFNVAKKLITNQDTLMLLIFSLVSMFVICTFDLWMPILVVNVVRWGVFELNTIMLGSGIVCTILMLVYWKAPPSRKANVYL